MKLLRNENCGIDFEFQKNFMELSSEYREIDEEDPRLLCQASWATVRYINDNLPEPLVWNNEDGILVDKSDNEYTEYKKVERNGTVYAVCPEAYKILDKILPSAIENGLKEVFGHARKR